MDTIDLAIARNLRGGLNDAVGEHHSEDAQKNPEEETHPSPVRAEPDREERRGRCQQQAGDERTPVARTMYSTRGTVDLGTDDLEQFLLRLTILQAVQDLALCGDPVPACAGPRRKVKTVAPAATTAAKTCAAAVRASPLM